MLPYLLTENKCIGDEVWNDCGHMEGCDLTCDSPEGGACAAVCVARCQCPSDKPVRYNERCIAQDQCPGEERKFKAEKMCAVK